MKSVLSILFLLVCFTTTSIADIIHVPRQQPTIQAGIDAAINGDTVLVAHGIYYENIRFKGKAVTVASRFIMDGRKRHIRRTVIDASRIIRRNTASAVYFMDGEDTTSVLSGFTITGGKGTVYTLDGEKFLAGGGIFIFKDSGAKITYNRIILNELKVTGLKAYGAGIYAAPGNARRTKEVVIRHNKIHNNTIVSGNSGYGGGIYVSAGSYDIQDNVIRANKVNVKNTKEPPTFPDDLRLAVGGGISCSINLPTTYEIVIANNRILKNEVLGRTSIGAGIYVFYQERNSARFLGNNPQPSVFNNLIAENKSDSRGGAVAVWTSRSSRRPGYERIAQPAFINNTMVKNNAKIGKAIYVYQSTPFVMNSILWNDRARGKEIYLDNGDIKIFASNVRGGEWSSIAKGNFDIDPRFIDDKYHIGDRSACNGLGILSKTIGNIVYRAPLAGLEDHSRPCNAHLFVDLGAYENNYECKIRPVRATVNKGYIRAMSDTLIYTTTIDNPEQHPVEVYAKMYDLDTKVINSMPLFDDGKHFDGLANDGVYGGFYGQIPHGMLYRTAVNIYDYNTDDRYTFFDEQYFTTIGPVESRGYELRHLGGGYYYLDVNIKNYDALKSVNDITVKLESADPRVHIANEYLSFGDIAPEEIVTKSFLLINSEIRRASHMTVHIYSGKIKLWHHGFILAPYEILSSHEPEENLKVYDNYPNPFNPSTTIRYYLPQDERVMLIVYNVLGEVVRTLVDEQSAAGEKSIVWDGRDNLGREVSSGVYIYRIQAGEFLQTRKMMLLR